MEHIQALREQHEAKNVSGKRMLTPVVTPGNRASKFGWSLRRSPTSSLPHNVQEDDQN